MESTTIVKKRPRRQQRHVHVDIIIPVYNAEETIEKAVLSATKQEIPAVSSLSSSSSLSSPCFVSADSVQSDPCTTTCHGSVDGGESAEKEPAVIQQSEHRGSHANSNGRDEYSISVAVCCYDDGSTDRSLDILRQMKERYERNSSSDKESNDNDTDTSNDEGKNRGIKIPSKLFIQWSKNGQSRGAGYARNRAIEINPSFNGGGLENDMMDSSSNSNDDMDGNDDDNDDDIIRFICWLDSDDIMHKHRVVEQTRYMLNLDGNDDNGDHDAGGHNQQQQQQLLLLERDRTLLGCTFVRDPPDATWHYAQWANNLTDERLMLERFREVTVIQPTWFMSRRRWDQIGPYLEAPIKQPTTTSSTNDELTSSSEIVQSTIDRYKTNNGRSNVYCLAHPTYETSDTLRLAEDLRLFMSHIQQGGVVKLLRHPIIESSVDSSVDSSTVIRHQNKAALVTYRQLNMTSQSFRTSRKLLLQLRCLAFEDMILRCDNMDWWSTQTQKPHDQQQQRFVIWGAGRDGKDFFKTLRPEMQKKVYCFVDVDAKKLQSGYYVYREDEHANNKKEELKDDKSNESKKKQPTKKSKIKYKIPIIHFSFLIPDNETRLRIQQEWENGGGIDDALHGRIDKSSSKMVVDINHGPSQTNESKTGDPITNDDKIEIHPPASKRAKTVEQVDSMNLKNCDEPSITCSESLPTSTEKATPLKKKPTISSALNLRGLDIGVLPTLPVVVCVAMYRTNGVLERNVGLIQRVEGKTLWHFS